MSGIAYTAAVYAMSDVAYTTAVYATPDTAYRAAVYPITSYLLLRAGGKMWMCGSAYVGTGKMRI